MNYVIKGNLSAYLCEDCIEKLSGVNVRIYKVANIDANLAGRTAANIKDTFHQLTEDEVKQKANLLLAETVTDDNGQFSFELSNRKDYNGEILDIDFSCGNVPHNVPGKKKYDELFFHLTTFQPNWIQREDALYAGFEFAITSRWWCYIRQKFDAWVICGRVVDCRSKQPLSNLQVFAYDVDLIQDDPLGSGVTDSSGHFRIDYTSADFSKTIFSWLNVEWPAGPDIYFKIVEPLTSTVLLQEDRSVGHQASRQNRGPCFCIELCVSDVPPTGNYFPALFERVGEYYIASHDDGMGSTLPPDFDAQGYTIAGQYAFTRSIPLIGQLPSGTNSNSMEYRFRIFNADSSYELTPLQVKNALNSFKIGELVKKDTSHTPIIYTQDVIINPMTDADAQGWIKVPRQNDFSDGGTGIFSPNGGILASLNTAKAALDASNTNFASESFDITSPVIKAGDAVPPAKKAAIHTFRIVFEAREVGSSVLSASNELAKIVFSNVSYKQRRHPSWGYSGDEALIAAAMIEIHETTAVDAGCGNITNTVTADYTCCHPHMGTMELYLDGNPVLPPAFTQNLAALDEANGNHVFNTSALSPCAYILWLQLTLRLTSGYGAIPDSVIYDHIAFCKS